MITDDPGTPGNKRWEINVAATLESRPGERTWEFPALDLNYGVGDRIQLTLQTPLSILQRRGHGPVAGLGITEAAVKWRFLDEEQNGISISTFPRILFHVLSSSVHRGLTDDGTSFQLPVQLAHKFGLVDLDMEVGPLTSTVGRSEWIYGVVAGIGLTKTTALMAEVHGTSRMNFDRDLLTVNVGLHQKLNDWCAFIGSLGRDIRSPDDEAFALIGYAGVQLTF